MDETYGIPGLGSYAAPGWGDYYSVPASDLTNAYDYGAPDAYGTPNAAPSQVPGTAGAPAQTPSSTPGGVNSGRGTNMPASPWWQFPLGGRGPYPGALAGGPMNRNQGLKLGMLGMNMMAPPAQRQNPQAMQIQRMFGVDYNTALQLMQMMPAGGARSPLPQMQYGGRPTGPTIVGERGPEIFTPDMPGTISPMLGANPPLRWPHPADIKDPQASYRS